MIVLSAMWRHSKAVSQASAHWKLPDSDCGLPSPRTVINKCLLNYPVYGILLQQLELTEDRAYEQITSNKCSTVVNSLNMLTRCYWRRRQDLQPESEPLKLMTEELQHDDAQVASLALAKFTESTISQKSRGLLFKKWNPYTLWEINNIPRLTEEICFL